MTRLILELVLMVMTIHPCTQYALSAVNGRRVAGQSEMLACQRHLKDLERQGTDGFPWVFDEERANRIYTWFGYCHHLEGPKAGQPIKLIPFEKFDLGAIFGWVHHETGMRRFEKAYMQMARKNGKSTLMSGVALYLMGGDREENPDVYCAAMDKQQARIIYKAAKSMAQKSPDIRKRLKIRDYEISHISRDGQLRALSKDTKNKDGLNPSGVILDEYHAHPTSEIHDLLFSSWGQRSQAIMLIITTAGMEAENNPCHREYLYCKQILQGIIQNERYFIMIRELDAEDDEHNPKVWIKANPLRAATPDGLARLKTQHDEAFGSKDPAKIRTFRVKNLNVWTTANVNSYMGEYMNEWDNLKVTPEEFYRLTNGLQCIAGLDLSKKIDLTADGFIFWLPELDKVAITAHGFIPSEAIAWHEKTDRVPYRDWAAGGWITVTEGDVTDYNAILTHIHDVELEHGWKIHEVAFDPYNATHLANQMQAEGYTTIEVRQGVSMLSEPTKLFRELAAQGKLIHDGSPLLKWCLANAVQVQDSNENIKLSKKNISDTQRIDLAAAVINAMVRLPALKEIEPEDISDQILDEEWGM
jgi:phage terminase large subunit-like protein